MSDLLPHLVAATLASSAAIALVLSLRNATTHRFGAGVAYAAWMLVPLAVVATLLPARSVVLIVKAVPLAAPIVATSIGDIGMANVATPSPDAAPGIATWLCALWIAGLVASLVVFVVQHQRFVRKLGRLEPLAGGLHRAETAQGCPALVGLLQPRIVVPFDFES